MTLSGTLNKRSRRTKVAVADIREALRAVLKDDHPMTVRQVFYQLVVRDVIEKSEAEYQGTAIRLLTDIRLSELPVVNGEPPEAHCPYHWHGSTPWETPREQLPYVCKADMVAFLDKAARVLVEGVDVRQVAENIISLFSLLAEWSRTFVIDSGNPVASNNEEVPHGR
jgi:hypothetical protein